MSKTKTFKGWIHFVNSKPLVGIARDGYDDATVLLAREQFDAAVVENAARRSATAMFDASRLLSRHAMTAERKAEQRCANLFTCRFSDGRLHARSCPLYVPPTESEPVEKIKAALSAPVVKCGACGGRRTMHAEHDLVRFQRGDYAPTITDHAFVPPAPSETPSAEVGAEPEYECQVWQGDDLVANAFGSSLSEVEREAAHYAAQYRQDGPVEVKLFVRYLLAAAKEQSK
jgi:hypothetical protein